MRRRRPASTSPPARPTRSGPTRGPGCARSSKVTGADDGTGLRKRYLKYFRNFCAILGRTSHGGVKSEAASIPRVAPMQEQTIFTEALERDDPADRGAFLDRVCGSDQALRQRIEKLLQRHLKTDDFLQSPARI